MAKFTAYVEFYGKKLKIVDAEGINEEDAKVNIQMNVKFIKIVKTGESDKHSLEDILDSLKNLFKKK